MVGRKVGQCLCYARIERVMHVERELRRKLKANGKMKAYVGYTRIGGGW